MTIPNFLSLSRIALTPLLWIGLHQVHLYKSSIWAVLLVIIFLYGEISDTLDGHLARYLKQESPLGQILDPFADLIFHLTIFFTFVLIGTLPAWAFLLILYREYLILFLRNTLLQHQITLPSQFSGKLKTVLYFLLSFFCLWSLLMPILFPGIALPFKESVIITLASSSVFLAYISLLHYSILAFRSLRSKP